MIVIPSSMIHLLTARKLRCEPSELFCIGCLAPDGVGEREVKDRSHYRSAPDRSAALAALAAKTDPADDYEEGVLLHLFTDWLWDECSFEPYKLAHCQTDPDWFAHYRREISLASTDIFHHSDWAIPLNRRMLAVPISRYGFAEAVTPEAANAYLNRNFKRHSENVTPPSEVFSPEFVEDFTDRTAREYRVWRGLHPKSEDCHA